MDSFTAFLENSDIFKGIHPSWLAEIKDKAILKRYKKGTIIYSEGEPADSVFFVKEGLVVLLKSNSSGSIMVGLAVPPMTFGVISGVSGSPRLYTAIAEKETSVYRFSMDDFRPWLDRHSEFSSGLLKYLAEQLRLLLGYMEINLKTVEKRLIHMITSLSIPYGTVIPLTREQMAEISNTTVESCVRNLKAMEKKGLIKTGRGKITILDLKALAKCL